MNARELLKTWYQDFFSCWNAVLSSDYMYNNDCKPHYIVENGNSFLDEAYAVVYNIQKFQMNRT